MPAATAQKAPPKQEAKPEFVLPDLSLMTPVEVTTTLDWSEFAGGLILKVGNRVADVWMIQGGHSGGMSLLRDCLHADDPWCTERPAMFEDGDRGIFRIAKSEKMLRLIRDQFVQINATIEMLVARTAALEEATEIKPSKPARGNGKSSE